MTIRPPKPGRPPASADGGKRKPRQIRFSDFEWEWVFAQASKRGEHGSEFARRRVLRGMPRVDAPSPPK